MENNQLNLFGTQPETDKASTDSSNQKIHLLALSKVRGIGLQTLRKAFERYGNLERLWASSGDEIRQFASKISPNEVETMVYTLRHEHNSLLAKAQHDLENYERKGIRIIFESDNDFPKHLSRTPDSPHWLFVEGNHKLLTQNNLVAMVGTRSPSETGLNNARKVSAIFAKNGFPIVSGLAEGIDAASHQTSVDYGNPCIAVLGTGISVTFPSSTANLRYRVAESGGAIITEYLPNDSYSKQRFVQRNRIQAAISTVVIPVEWSEKGGTSHTIRYAEKYKRPVIFLSGPANTSIEPKIDRFVSSSLRYVINPSSSNLEMDIIHIMQELGVNGDPTAASSKHPKRLMQSVVDEFNRLLKNYEFSDSDFADLLDELRNKWKGK